MVTSLKFQYPDYFNIYVGVIPHDSYMPKLQYPRWQLHQKLTSSHWQWGECLENELEEICKTHMELEYENNVGAVSLT